jgi:hypothetical protein
MGKGVGWAKKAGVFNAAGSERTMRELDGKIFNRKQ